MMWALVVALLIVTVGLVGAMVVLLVVMRDMARQNARLNRAVIAKNAQEFDIMERTAARPEVEKAKRSAPLAAVPDDPRARIAQAIDSDAAMPRVPEGFGG